LVMAVVALAHLDRHDEEAGRFPEMDAALHAPGRCRGAAPMASLAFAAGTLGRMAEAALHALHRRPFGCRRLPSLARARWNVSALVLTLPRCDLLAIAMPIGMGIMRLSNGCRIRPRIGGMTVVRSAATNAGRSIRPQPAGCSIFSAASTENTGTHRTAQSIAQCRQAKLRSAAPHQHSYPDA
jgi:hypothetical protein